MRTKKVVVLPYDPSWREEFEKLKHHFENALGNRILAVEHVGSTSVEGLAAKPIIDIDIVIRSRECFEDVKSGLEELGYSYEGDLGIKDREAFAYRDQNEFMTHHLYVCPQDSEELHRHITFRDYLRTHKEDREKYNTVKLQAALKYPTDIDRYMEEKSPCIKRIYKKCGL